MKRYFSVFLLIFLIVSLSGCGSGDVDGEDDKGNIQSMNYDEYKKTLDSDYTGFAYLISVDDEYLDIVKDIFEEQEANLAYFNSVEASEAENEQLNDDSTTSELEFFHNKVGYIKNGEPVAEIDISQGIEKSEGYDEVEEFVNKHKD